MADAENAGYEFWRRSLKCARYMVAPMVDQSELAWRLLSRRYGAQLCYTPMLHASVFVRDANYRKEGLASCPEDRPLIAQFCANDPAMLLKAAKYAEGHCEAIDLNLGCPQSIARRGHYGSFLQDEWPLLHNMVSQCAKELSVPITCKIRVFKDVEKTVKYAQMLESAGCKLLTVHGRTQEQKGCYTGVADWQHIKAVKDNVKIPVFANGNIQYMCDVERCLKETGVDGVMSAEGNLHNPALFSGQQPKVWDMAEEYLDLVEQYPCPISYIRGHVFKLLHHALQVHLAYRDVMGNGKTVQEFRRVVSCVKQLCQDDVALYESDPGAYKTDLPCPYWICQPYVRPDPDENKELKREARSAEQLKRAAQEALALADGALGEDGQPLSWNKLKKIRRNPKKSFVAKEDRYVKCGHGGCGNPRGSKCGFELCRACCKQRAYKDKVNCPGHRLYIQTKSRAERQEAQQNHNQTDTIASNSDSNCNPRTNSTCDRDVEMKCAVHYGKAATSCAVQCGKAATSCAVQCGKAATSCAVQCGKAGTSCAVHYGKAATSCAVQCGKAGTCCANDLGMTLGDDVKVILQDGMGDASPVTDTSIIDSDSHEDTGQPNHNGHMEGGTP